MVTAVEAWEGLWELERGGEDFWPMALATSRVDFLAADLVRPGRGAEETFGGIVGSLQVTCYRTEPSWL